MVIRTWTSWEFFRTGVPDEAHDSILTVLFGDGAGGFSNPEEGFVVSELITSVEHGDFNCDGQADLVLIGPENLRFRVLLREASGWAPPLILQSSGHPADGSVAVTGSLSVATGDFNGDGAHDLIASPINFTPNGEHLGHLIVYYGNGRGQFEPPEFLELSSDGALWTFVTTADLNSDGLDDFITAGAYPTGAVEFVKQFSLWMAV